MKHEGTIYLETEKLILRKFIEEDDEDMFNNWASDSEVTKFLTWPNHGSVQISREVINTWINSYSNLENYQWAIEVKESKSVVGSVSLMNIDNHNENCEIGYCLSKSLWNKGIMTETFLKIIDFAFFELGFQRITGRHEVANTASGRVMEKCGLTYEGTLRKINKNSGGILVYCKYYSILKGEIRNEKK